MICENWKTQRLKLKGTKDTNSNIFRFFFCAMRAAAMRVRPLGRGSRKFSGCDGQKFAGLRGLRNSNDLLHLSNRYAVAKSERVSNLRESDIV